MMRFLLPCLLSSSAGLMIGSAQDSPNASKEIVSSWKLNGGNTLLIFRYDGVYYQIEDSATRPGFERGTYEWSSATGGFSVETMVDTNGTGGFSHPGGAMTVSITGDTLTFTAAGGSPSVFSRVVNTSSAIVGSWMIPGEHAGLTFLADGTYYVCGLKNDAPSGYDGIERGTYTWDPVTKALTAAPITDTNGDTGFSSLPENFTATVDGNRLTFSDDETPLQRINANLFALPDFAVFKDAVYWQSEGNGPVLAAAAPEDDEYPYFAGAEIAVPGVSSPTLKIGSRTPIPFSSDEDDPGYFDIETDYLTLASLNAASGFPNDTNYEFRSGTSTAVLRFPSGAALPEAPAVLTGDGSWEDGIHQLPTTGILNWSRRVGYNAATDFVVIDVEDDETGDDIIDDLVMQGDLSTCDLGHRLTPGRTYFVTLLHSRVQNTTTTGTGPFAGVTGMAFTEAITDFLMQSPATTPGSPVITEQPVSQTAAAGSKVILTAGVAETFPAATFQWFKGVTAIPGQTGNSLALFGITAGDYGSYTVKATANGITVESAAAVIQAPGPASAYDTFVSGFGLDPATNGAPGVDRDKDGMANLLEFLLGGNPTASDTAILPKLTSVPITNGRTLTYTYDRRIAAAGLQQIVEHSATLAPPWTTASHGTGGVVIAVNAIPGDSIHERVTLTIPVTGDKRFVRLRAVQ